MLVRETPDRQTETGSELIATVTSISKSNANSSIVDLLLKHQKWRMAMREWTRSNRCRSRSRSFSVWIRSRGGESPQISAQKAPQKRKRKRKSKSVSGSLWTTKTGRERERERVSGDSSFTLDKIFDVEQISSRPWSEERERESRECTKREKRKEKKEEVCCALICKRRRKRKGQKKVGVRSSTPAAKPL